MAAIRKFNLYCAQLAQMSKPKWGIPLPEALPTQLTHLRECSHLMEDVWISPSETDIPRWLEDAEAREGICSLLKVDRCIEERQRLGREADNLCRWFGKQLMVLEHAIAHPLSEYPNDYIVLIF